MRTLLRLGLVISIVAPAFGAGESTTVEHDRLAFHHVRPGTIDSCMVAVMAQYQDTTAPIRWMPFIGTGNGGGAWATYECTDGRWTIIEANLRATLAGVRDGIAAAGYIMVDWEAFRAHPGPCEPMQDPPQDVEDRKDRMVETAQIVDSWLEEQFGPEHEIGFGFYRVPDHKHPSEQTGNAYAEILDPHTNTIFISLHTSLPSEMCDNDECPAGEDCTWRRYQCRVQEFAPNHDIVAYFFGAGDESRDAVGCGGECNCSCECNGPVSCCYSVAEIHDRIARIEEFFPDAQLVARGRGQENAHIALDTARNWLFDLQNTCPWDLNDSRNVEVTDFFALLDAWGTDPGGPPDFDGNGDVDIVDFLTLLNHWGPCP